ncbi:MAG: hypothetical protein ACI4XM_08430 [Candidatus Coprovivens sp.]
MKKQLHILKGLFILTTIIIASLLLIKFIYQINNEKLDTKYLWDISFTNLKVKEGSTTKGKTSIDKNNLTIEAELSNELEYYEITIDIENKGTLKAQLDDIELSIDNEQNILKHQITYVDDTPIKKGDYIEPKSNKTIKIRVEYPHPQEKIYESLKIKINLNMKYIAFY